MIFQCCRSRKDWERKRRKKLDSSNAEEFDGSFDFRIKYPHRPKHFRLHISLHGRGLLRIVSFRMRSMAWNEEEVQRFSLFIAISISLVNKKACIPQLKDRPQDEFRSPPAA